MEHKHDTHPKKSENLVEFIVADVTMSFKSRRRCNTLRRMPNSTSVCSDRSWASSITMAEYCSRSGAFRDSRNSTPSVMYLIFVTPLVVWSSNRMLYPTSLPSGHPTSSLTRLATDMAATRRGCVQPIMPYRPYPSSIKYCVSCVVFPLPVSPTITTAWLSAMTDSSWSRTS